jgi:hypothetical protein
VVTLDTPLKGKAMPSNSPGVKVSPTSTFDFSGSDLDRSAHYGGLVGNLWTEIEARMASGASMSATSLAADSNPDFVHMLSVASGYVGLVLGFVATAVACAFLIF